MAICLKSGWKWLIQNPEFHIALFFRACLNFSYNFKGHDEIFLISSHWLQQMGICNAQNQPSLDCCSRLPRDALKATDVASKNNAPDVQLIIGLHFPKQLQTGTRATAYVCVSPQTQQQAHRHTSRHIDTPTDASSGGPAALQGAAWGCSALLRRLPLFCFIFFSRSEALQAKMPRGLGQGRSFLLRATYRKAFCDRTSLCTHRNTLERI